MARRLNTFRNANEAINGDPSISDFFKEYKNEEIAIKDIKITDQNEDKSQVTKDFIHRKSRYFAYLTREQDEKKDEIQKL